MFEMVDKQYKIVRRSEFRKIKFLDTNDNPLSKEEADKIAKRYDSQINSLLSKDICKEFMYKNEDIVSISISKGIKTIHK